MAHKTKDNWEHLGDGVYANFDGYGVVLHANDHLRPTDHIYLEPSVVRALIIKIKDIKILGAPLELSDWGLRR